MTHTVKRTFAMLLLAFFGSALLYNCEPDADSLGEQLFIGDAVQGNEKSYSLIAYNIDNKDSLSSDASKLISQINTSGISPATAVLGAFKEDQFGMQKASFVSQLRLSQYDFDFGTAPKVDSVVLVIKPGSEAQYKKDSVDARPAADIDFLVGSETVKASIEKKFYPVVKYGRGKIGTEDVLYHVNVQEVTTFLDANNKAQTKSNFPVSTGNLLGTTTFNGNLSAVTVTRKSDNASLFTGDIGMRIPLDKNYFQTKILDKNKKPELQNAANFIRHVNGIRISVDELNGYLFQFSPNNTEVLMYYSNETTTNGTTTRTQQTPYRLTLAGARLGQYEYNRAGSAWADASGNDKLFLQGMGGPSIAVKIDESEINDMKALYNNDKAAIISARIRIYVDNDAENVNASWNNKYPKPQYLTLVTAVDNTNLVPDGYTADLLAGFGLLNSFTDKNPAYYEFVVTKTIKDIIEKKGVITDDDNKPLIINAGDFIKDTSSAYYGFKYTTRAFAMDRAVFVGSIPGNKYGIALKVTYGTKK